MKGVCKRGYVWWHYVVAIILGIAAIVFFILITNELGLSSILEYIKNIFRVRR